jgi:hypothetical protein
MTVMIFFFAESMKLLLLYNLAVLLAISVAPRALHCAAPRRIFPTQVTVGDLGSNESSPTFRAAIADLIPSPVVDLLLLHDR